jgi:hypothetical protein
MFEALAEKVLYFVIGLHPMVALVFMALGVIFFLCELFVKATPNKEDDKRLAAIKSGYLGPFINFFIQFAKKKILKK